MTIKIIPYGDAERMERFILENDPFQLSSPCWVVRVWNLLPPPTIKTIGEYDDMAIKVVEEKAAPERFFKRGTISNKQDWNDVLIALRTLKAGQAMVVGMTEADWKDIEKPETKFGYTLRRYFEQKGLDITAYQSGKLEVTIRKATALDKRNSKKSK